MKHQKTFVSSWVTPSLTCKPGILVAAMSDANSPELGEIPSSGSVLLALELTQQCNLRCKHCYLSAGPSISDRHKVSKELWIRCLIEAKRSGIERVQFIGGEVTLHPLLCTLIERAGNMQFRDVEVFCNATRLDNTLLDILGRNSVRVATSLYGANGELHDQFTNVQGSFARTCKNIKRTLAAGIQVRLSIVRHRDETTIVEDSIKFARELGVQNISVDVVRAFGRGKQYGNTVKNCKACGVSVLRVCSDGVISGCSMSLKPTLGHIKVGVKPALEKLVLQSTGSVTKSASRTPRREKELHHY